MDDAEYKDYDEEEYVTMNDLRNSNADVDVVPEDIVNNPAYISYINQDVPYISQRQSVQMETFVDKFIKPKLANETFHSSIQRDVTLTKKIMKRVSKKRINFNLVIIGEDGLGKSTFIEALIKDDLKMDNKEETFKVVNETMSNNIVERSFVLLKDEQKIHLNILEVPKFGKELNNENSLLDILIYVEQSFIESFKLECSLDRSSQEDKKIHCCLYFISPFGHSLKPLDIAFFQQFQSKINIIPVIGRCDVFTKNELKRFKSNILKDFENNGINLFGYLNNSEPIEDELDDIKYISEEIKNNIPFAISSSINTLNAGNNFFKSCREYPWGIVETKNPEISDFYRLEKILTTSNINYFKKLTKIVHYENFRMKYILDRVK